MTQISAGLTDIILIGTQSVIYSLFPSLNVCQHPLLHHTHFNTKLSMTLRNTWKQTEDGHGMDFALDLTQASIFSGNPKIKL